MAPTDSGAPSLQERLAPTSICYGCGPANAGGLRIRSFPSDDGQELVCSWTPAPHHHAFPGVLNGGVIGTLLDCHMNWTATWTLMTRDGLDHPPCTVTADYEVKLRRPCPMGTVTLRAHAAEIGADRVTVEATLEGGGKVCAAARGLFVAVKPGHPAYFRW